MTKKTITDILSIITISALSVGCGETTSSTPETTTISGIVIDDYIQGATVCIDSNQNGKLDAEDTNCVTTNATGQFTITADASTLGLPLVMSGGTDVASKKPFTGTLTSPAGSTVINPLTSIVQAVVASGQSITEAQTTVKTNLNLPLDVDLTSYDPLAALSTGTETEKETAKKVFAQQTSIQTILTSVSATIVASVSDTTIKEADVSSHAATEIANLMLAPATVGDVASTENVETIINTTVASATPSATLEPVLVTAIASQVNATSTQAVESISNNTSNSVTEIRTAAAQTSIVVSNNVTATTEAIKLGTPQDEIATNTVETATDELSASIAAVTIDTTELETVAPPPTAQPAVTGAEGAN